MRFTLGISRRSRRPSRCEAPTLREIAIGLDGFMHEAPGSGLIWRQRGQIGEIEAAASPHATSCRARHGIEPHGPERLAADAANSRFHGHMLHIQTAAGSFNSRAFATAAAISSFDALLRWLIGAQVKAWRHSKINDLIRSAVTGAKVGAAVRL
jgi:hypothetical protein